MQPLSVLALWLAVALPAQQGEMFEAVVRVLSNRLYGGPAARSDVQRLARELRPRLAKLASDTEERSLVQSLLQELGVSHLALYSQAAHRSMSAELAEHDQPTFGFQLVELGGSYYADWIYEGGPAELAGLRRGERVLALDGSAVAHSPRLDWPTDDAALPDPPLHALLCQAPGEWLELSLAQPSGAERKLRICSALYSGARALRASAAVHTSAGLDFGYAHLWFMSSSEPADCLRELLLGAFRDCAAIVLDLRGRGGYPSEVERVLRLFEGPDALWSGPLVLLTHASTRSAKEVLAYRLQQSRRALVVGERTAGAVVPASFAEVGGGAVLMYPASGLGRLTEQLEGRGVVPDVLAAGELADAQGADPILEAGWVAARIWCEALRSVR